jgi:hypothetical protein
MVFDREGREGPWALLKSWQFVCTATGQKFHCPEAVSLNGRTDRVEISRDGHRLFVDSPNKSFLLKLRERASFGGHSRYDLEVPPKLPTWNVMRVVEAISPFENGLAIRGRSNNWRSIRMIGPRISMDMVAQLPTVNNMGPVQFPLAARTTNDGFHLRAAQWPNGSKALLDSRGILHLKSHDPHIPEISLVLSDIEIAGWTSDGYVCGPKFFFEQDHISAPEKVFDAVSRFVAAL